VVLAAGRTHTPHSAEALECLCRSYWRPVYNFVRRHGHDLDTARDLTQEFFARLLEGNWLQPADPNRGRFRSFLLRCLSRFLVDEWRRATAQKRGGRMIFFSIDEAREQEDVSIEPVDSFTPEQAYDRTWAEAVVSRANARLRRGYETEGLIERFHVLKGYLASDQEPLSYAAAAEQLGLTLPAVKSAIYKLRQRYGEAVRAEIAETVSRPEDVETELNHLLDALGG
jgi:RNA polymerase sigma-70 factor (ECF subfamily)